MLTVTALSVRVKSDTVSELTVRVLIDPNSDAKMLAVRLLIVISVSKNSVSETVRELIVMELA